MSEQDAKMIEGEREEWRRRRRRGRLKQSLTIASPVFLLMIWEILSRTNLVDARFFPPPTEIIGTFIALMASGELFNHLTISLLRIAGGFFLGVIPGIIIGLFMGLYKPVKLFVQPIVMSLMPIPTIALLPIFIILFGIGEVSKVITIATSVFFPVVINSAAGVMGIDSIYMDVARNFGATGKDYMLKIALPGALPVMFEGIQMGQAIALLTIVAAEMVGATSGIGYLIWTSYSAFVMKEMYVGLVLISFFGYLFSLGVRALQSRMVPWQ
ncbi:ABC transporter permease [Sporolactobacillus sp. THM19-2]|uniref:ABC transporter permease n=1 Tax=Sporolactobacillus sp. THM19-2 TaxID=2511171 RepID=UPI0010216D7A|nr:ABC transporter permease [Sporolactobacillus sp. THM19-2]RYL92461.1 ABC transporter permease [Sporolactobacillus sp. THM19-2]